MRYLPYVRVSERGSSWHEKGIETSIPLQLEQIRAWILARDPQAVILPAVADEFFSARTGIPPGMQGILDQIESGLAQHEWDCLVVLKLSRFSRSALHGNRLFHALLAHDLGLASVQENLDYTTVSGRLFLQMSLVFNEAAAAAIASDTRTKMIGIARRGEWPAGKTPYGYRRKVVDGETTNVLEPDEHAPTIRALFRGYASGQNSGQLAARFQIRDRSILKLLRNPVYVGRLVYGDHDGPGQHAPIIDQDTYDRVQDLLPKTVAASVPSRQAYPYLLSGLVVCTCGGPMVPGVGNGKGGRYPYYRCRDKACAVTGVRADHLEKAAIQAVGRMAIDRRVIEAAIAEIHADLARQKASAAPELAETERTLSTLRRQLANLESALLDGTIDRSNRATWNQRQREMRDQVSATKPTPPSSAA